MPFIFSLPFFNDTLHGDDEQSWADFKEKVFYDYLRNLKDNIAKVNAEITVVKQIENAFSELLAQQPVAPAAPPAAPAAADGSDGSDGVADSSSGRCCGQRAP